MRERPTGHLDHPAGSAVATVNKKPMSVRVIGDAHAPAALSYRTPNVRNPG